MGKQSRHRGSALNHKILICGLNGAGKSTLGKSLAERMQYRFIDVENYYFTGEDEEYPYDNARTREEVAELLLEDMRKYDNLIFTSGKGNYGDEVISLFTEAILICVPKEIRMKRVRDRSFQKFGDRILPGGDLYEKEKQFFSMAEHRLEHETEDWLKSVHIPMMQVDGTKMIDDNVNEIMKWLRCGKDFGR